MPNGLVAIAAGLGSAVSFGGGDFAGGLAARRISGLAVIAGSQLIGFLLLSGVFLATGRPAPPSLESLGLGAAAGVSGAIGVAALYRALATGAMGLLAAISGAGAVTVPLVVSVALLGSSIRPLQAAGVGCAGLAVLAASGASRGASRAALALALLAALGFGFWYLLLDRAAIGSGLWALLASRCAGALSMTLAAVSQGRLREVRLAWPLVAVSGLADVGGNALYVVARAGMPVSLAAAMSGIYPLITMLLARAVLRERLPPLGLLGVALALLAIILISTG